MKVRIFRAVKGFPCLYQAGFIGKFQNKMTGPYGHIDFKKGN